MLVLIVFAVLAVILITLTIIASHEFWETEGMFGVLSLLVTLGVIMFSLSLINLDKRFDEFKYRYEYTKQMVESYHGFEYGNTFNLTEEMLKINSTIARHKAYCNNVWTSKWYSKDIANLEPLKFIDFDI